MGLRLKSHRQQFDQLALMMSEMPAVLVAVQGFADEQ
jgi:hypothetical protein